MNIQDNMERFCRGCLTKYSELVELIQYTEKNRRLFVYSTGIQVKHNDVLAFQLCKDCYLNMKAACKFKKFCRNSDKKLKNYLALKEAGDTIDFETFLKSNDDLLTFRLPMTGNSTPANYKAKDDDNESNCTSIQNFMTDILQSEEIPDSEARIIRQVIEEEADILDDSLDSHWLQDDVSIDTDFKLDLSFSPFSTTRYVQSDTPKKPTEQKSEDNVQTVVKKILVETENNNETKKPERKCPIDKNLENALRNEADTFCLDDLLSTPPLFQNITAPSTPTITNILFGDKLDDESKNVKQYIENFEPEQGDIEFLDEFLKKTEKEFDTEEEGNETKLHSDETKTSDEEKVKTEQPLSPIENMFNISNFYCKMCKKQFKNLVALKVHATKSHKLKIPFMNPYVRKTRICDHCGKSYYNLAQFLLHIESHNQPKMEYNCKRCTLKCSSEARLKMHMTTHTGNRTPRPLEDVRKKLVCTICGATSTTIGNFLTHQRRHSKTYTVSCDLCGRGFYRKAELTAHMRHHTGEKPFSCDYCTRSFGRRDTLNRHMKCHTDEKPFECQHCKQRFPGRNQLKTHIEKSKTCIELRNKLAEQEVNKPVDSEIKVFYAKVANNTDILLSDHVEGT